MRITTALLMTTTCLLTACAGGQDMPPPSVSYVEATQVEPPRAEQVARVPLPITPVNPIPEPKVRKFRSHEAATAAAVRNATVTALDGSFEGAVLNYVYRHGQRYRVVLDGPSEDFEQDSDTTLLMLGPDDGTEPDSGFGDPSYFLVDKVAAGVDETSMRAKRDKVRAISSGTHQTVLPLKCYKRGARTTMFVTTPRRTYLLDLHCSKHHKVGGYNPAVQFTFVGDQVSQAPKVPKTSAFSRPAPVVADNRYAIEGPEEWRPREWSAWNDGANTHIRPSPSIRSRPAPLLGAGGSFYIDPATNEYVVTGLPLEIRFPWGGNALLVRKLP